jgi:hypothetical protein
VYREYKEREKKKENERLAFFNAATREHETKSLARRMVTITAGSEDDINDIVADVYPREKLISIRFKGSVGDQYKVILEEKPEYKPFTFINPKDNQVYTRQIVDGPPVLDERLANDHPELFEKITEEVTERVPKDLDTVELTDDEQSILATYFHEGKPQIKMSAPRKATQEELDEL